MIAIHVTAARVLERAPAALAEFWALADCPPGRDACWRWHGYTDRTGRPVLRVWRTTLHATRVAWYAVTGEYPTAVRFTHACGDVACVRPSHVRWSTSALHRREVGAYSDGYGRAPGAVCPDAECAAARAQALGRPARPAGPPRQAGAGRFASAAGRNRSTIERNSSTSSGLVR